MIYDSADIELLRFAAAAKNIPPDLQYRLSSRVWDREHIHTLCAQKLLAENRNHLSISLTLKGATLLNHLGWPVTLDAKQPARNKLERRLQSAWTAALFYRAGFGIFNNKASDLAMPETYLPANALRRDTTVATTRVFAGVRYMGIAHSAERMLLAHYVDGGHMYITSEMRMFNTMAVALSNACTPAVIYCGLCYDDLARLLTGASAFMPAKRRGSDAVTYRVGAERTQYPLFLVETTNTGVFQIALITRVRDYYHLQMPRWLFADSRYKLLALESKVAYTFLLNRFQLSRMNGWINDAGEVFIIFTRQELADEMQISFRKAIECFQELVSAKLIWERRMGRGYPNQIYLAAVQLSQEDAQAHTSAPFDKKTRHADSAHLESCQTCGNDTSRDAKMAHLDMPKPQASNTERIQIREERPSLSQTDEDELREILGSCELHLFQRQTAGVFQHAVTRLFYAEQWWLDHSQLPRSVIRQTLHSLDGSILQAVERKLQENTQQQIQNTMAYTMTVILNEVWECEADLLLDPELNRTMEFSANMKEGFP